ncbi:hypothetical protein [Gemmatimonas sp.]|nr:hypothetical protein [Gemmatimonas sp.]
MTLVCVRVACVVGAERSFERLAIGVSVVCFVRLSLRALAAVLA